MARPRTKKSKTPFGNLGLDEDNESKLKLLLKIRDTSLQRLKRLLLKQWIKDNEPYLKTYYESLNKPAK